MDPVSIFYSWQSDHDGRICRHFIERALRAAASQIEADRGIPFFVDSDTAGVPGTPPITETILAKIGSCDIFVADVTFVGQTATKKLLPNPNVMAEYGYARRAKGNERILLVMNEAFGPPTALPFDLQHMRFPASYQAPLSIADGLRRSTRASFGDSLVPKLGAIVDCVLRDRTSAIVNNGGALRSAQSRLAGLGSKTRRGDNPVIVSKPCMRVALTPFVIEDDAALEPRNVIGLKNKFVPQGFQNAQWESWSNSEYWSCFGTPTRIQGYPNPESRWHTRLHRPGIFEQLVVVGTRESDDPTILVDGRQLEARIVRGLVQLAELALDLGFGGPALVECELFGVEDAQLAIGPAVGRVIGLREIRLGEATIPSLDELDRNSLTRMLEKLWLDAGFEHGSPLS